MRDDVKTALSDAIEVMRSSGGWRGSMATLEALRSTWDEREAVIAAAKGFARGENVGATICDAVDALQEKEAV